MSEEKKSAADFLDEAAGVFRERRAVYGDNYLRIGHVMKTLFPNGVTLKTSGDFVRFQLFMADIIKTTRYVENWNRGGHDDSLTDGSVYKMMLLSVDTEFRKNEPPF